MMYFSETHTEASKHVNENTVWVTQYSADMNIFRQAS